MKPLQSPLIANYASRQLSALGQKQIDRIIRKACEANNTHRYSRDARPLVDQVTTLVRSLIFEHHVTKEQLSAFQKAIKVTNNKMELPAGWDGL